MLAIRAKQHFWDGDEAKKRPELYISGSMMLPLEAGKPETVLLGLKNRGHAIARNIRLGGGNHLFTTDTFSGPLEYKPVAVDTRADLGPGDEENSLISRSSEPLTAKRIKELNDGKVLFFHFAEGEYDDDDGVTYPIDYCYMYNPLSPTVMRTCPEKYWPRERKHRKFPPRPKLVIQSAGVNMVAGEQLDVHVAFTNQGDADVARMWMEGITTIHSKSFKGPLERKGMTRNEAPIAPAIGATMTATLREGRRWTEDGIAIIERGEKLLLHFGRAEYMDALGNLYWLEFCLRYEPSIPVSPSGLRYMSFADKSFFPKESEDIELALSGSLPEATPQSERPIAKPLGYGSGAPSQTWVGHPGPYDHIKWTDYTEDYFYDAIWRWKYRPEMGSNEPRDIHPFCPECDSPLRKIGGTGLVKPEKGRTVTFQCAQHVRLYHFQSPSYDDFDGIRALIIERLQNGQWEKVVKRQYDARGRIM
jgi:hypothetical protein